mgnify:CR=1 FL=1
MPGNVHSLDPGNDMPDQPTVHPFLLATLLWLAPTATVAQDDVRQWTSVDAHGVYNCATTEAGGVFCWGDLPWGGTQPEPTPVESDRRFEAVSAGPKHACALDESGRAFCWGENSSRQLGAPERDRHTLARQPVPVAGAGRFRNISAAQRHTCAVSTGGEVHCWGYNRNGQLGVSGRQNLAPVPAQVSEPVTQVVTNRKSSCALTERGTIWCWGEGAPRPQDQLGDAWKPRKLDDGTFDAISANRAGICATNAEGHRCWPDKVFGRYTPRGEDAEQGDPEEVPRLERLELSQAAACGLTDSGRAFCWGYNQAGILGDGTTEHRMQPRPVATDARFTDIALGAEHACGVTDGGELMCWGKRRGGRLGFVDFPELRLGAQLNRKPKDQRRRRRSSRGKVFRLVISGRGRNQSCLLPEDKPGRYCRQLRLLTDEQLANWRPFGSLALGAEHLCLLDESGTARCALNGWYGQLGNGKRQTSHRFVDVGDGETTYQALTAGSRHTCGLTDADQIRCWGMNKDGAVGSEAGQLVTRPTPVAGDHSWTQVAAGQSHTCGLDADGRAFCWGDNRFGQLGDGSTDAHRSPVEVAGGHRFAGISTFGVHTCGYTGDGDVYCWGLNARGQIGTKSGKQHPTPRQVPLDATITSVGAGLHHTCAMTDNNELYCWGLGNSAPRMVAEGEGLARQYTGGDLTCMFDEESRLRGCLKFETENGVTPLHVGDAETNHGIITTPTKVDGTR